VFRLDIRSCLFFRLENPKSPFLKSKITVVIFTKVVYNKKYDGNNKNILNYKCKFIY